MLMLQVGPLILARNVARDAELIVQHCNDEELLLNAVSTLTNLSFYENWAPNTAIKVHHRGPIFQNRLSLLTLLLPLATHENDEVVAHALRVIGNLSRDAEVRQLAVTLKGLDLLSLLLDKTDPEIVVTACGILVNFASDATFVSAFASLTTKLVEVVDQALEADEAVCDQIATNAMKSIGNLLGHGVKLRLLDRKRLFKVLDSYFGEGQEPSEEEDPELVAIAQALLKQLHWGPAEDLDESNGGAAADINVLEPL